MNKRGQFFLFAAFVVIAILSGLATIATEAKVNNKQTQFYDLSNEIGDETKHVIDYGVYNQQNTDTLLSSFLTDYASYIAQEETIFIYGNASGVKALVFQNINSGSVGIATYDGISGTPISVPIQEIEEKDAQVSIEQGNNIVIKINEIKYQFNLLEGQNFYFVIIKNTNGERIVAQG